MGDNFIDTFEFDVLELLFDHGKKVRQSEVANEFRRPRSFSRDADYNRVASAVQLLVEKGYAQKSRRGNAVYVKITPLGEEVYMGERTISRERKNATYETDYLMPEI